MNKKVFIFIGRSGCGKGTQAKLLMKHLAQKGESTYYVSTGDEFRRVFDMKTYTSEKLREIVGKGAFCPSFAAVCMWATALFRDVKENDHIIIDGSPRSLDEASVLDTVAPFYGAEPIAVYINVSSEWATEKLLARGRGDDTKEAVASRMNLFETAIVPILERYKNDSHMKVVEVNGDQSIEDVHKELVAKLGV